MTKSVDVIIVGCGASGVAALRRLHDAGLKVLGLEAADRIGGRICTIQRGECALDIGAAWCHGEEENIVFEMVKDLDLLGRPQPDHRWFVSSDGNLVPNHIAETIENALNTAVTNADKDNTKSISECVREAAEKNETMKKQLPLTDSFIEWFERNNHVGGQTDPRTGKSLRGLRESKPCAGEFMLNWKGKGYRTVLDVLLKKIPSPSEEIPVEILLNKEVDCIKWKSTQKDAGVTLVQVGCKDGSSYSAKAVIVTISLGVLKERYNQLFDPPLPAEKINAINNLQMCLLGKIYVEFEKPWWAKFPANFTILWKSEDKSKFTAKEKWITEIYGLNTVEYHPNMLLAWIYGDGAVEMEGVSLEEVKDGIAKLMTQVFEKQFDVTPIKSVVRTQWASNPLARGAYSYRSVSTEVNGGSAVTLSEPLCGADNLPKVCFAGEATSHYRHSAVHGAVEAGFREADRLIETLKK